MTTGIGDNLGWPNCQCYWTDRSDYEGDKGTTAEKSNYGTAQYRGRKFYRVTNNSNCPVHSRG
jgi:hypothetical protein